MFLQKIIKCNLLIMTDSKSLKVGALQHKKSNVVENGAPKLPSAEKLLFGEIAINYAEGYETLSIKNSNENVVTFSSDNINEGKLDKVKNDLTQAVADEKTRAEGKEGELNNTIATEKSRAEAKELELNNAIAAEKERAEGKEGELAQSVADEKTRAEGKELELSNAIATETATRQEEDGKLSQAIAAEKERAEGKEGELSNAIATEKERAEGKELELNNAITAEKTRAEGKEGELAQAVADEKTRAEGAEKKLGEDLATAVSRLEGLIGDVEGGIAGATTITDKTDGHVIISASTDQVTGALIYTITENDIASDAALNTVNNKIDAFLNAAEIGDAAVDTLKEIQDYIDTHGEAAAQMVADIADNKSAISALTQTVIDNKNTLDGKDSELAQAIAAEKERAEGKEGELAQAIANKQDKLIDNTYTAVTYPTIEGVTFKDVESNDDIQTAIHKVDDNVASLASGLATEITRAMTAESGLTETIEQKFNNLANQIDAVSADTDAKVEQLNQADATLNAAISTKQNKNIDETYTAVTYPTIEGVTFKQVDSTADIQTAIHIVDDNVASLASGLTTEISNKQNKKIDENYLNVNYPTVGESQFLSVKSNMTIQNAINVVENNVAQLATEVTKIPLPLDVTSLISDDFMEITFNDLAASNLYCALEDGVAWVKGEMIGNVEDYVDISDGKQYYFISKSKGKETIFKVWVDTKGYFNKDVCETIPADAIEITTSFRCFTMNGHEYYNMSGIKYNITPVKYVGECTTGELLGGFLIVETMSMLETTTSVYHLTETTRDGIYGLMVDKDNSFEYVSNTYAIMKMKQDAYDEVTKNDKTLYVIEEE